MTVSSDELIPDSPSSINLVARSPVWSRRSNSLISAASLPNSSSMRTSNGKLIKLRDSLCYPSKPCSLRYSSLCCLAAIQWPFILQASMARPSYKCLLLWLRSSRCRSTKATRSCSSDIVYACSLMAWKPTANGVFNAFSSLCQATCCSSSE